MAMEGATQVVLVVFFMEASTNEISVHEMIVCGLLVFEALSNDSRTGTSGSLHSL